LVSHQKPLGQDGAVDNISHVIHGFHRVASNKLPSPSQRPWLESIITPHGEFALVDIAGQGLDEGMRTYAWVEK